MVYFYPYNIYIKNFSEPGRFSEPGSLKKRRLMGDRYKAIKQKWEMDYDGCRFFMDYDEYKLKALHQKKNLQEQQCCSQETK